MVDYNLQERIDIDFGVDRASFAEDKVGSATDTAIVVAVDIQIVDLDTTGKVDQPWLDDAEIQPRNDDFVEICVMNRRLDNRWVFQGRISSIGESRSWQGRSFEVEMKAGVQAQRMTFARQRRGAAGERTGVGAATSGGVHD